MRILLIPDINSRTEKLTGRLHAGNDREQNVNTSLPQYAGYSLFLLKNQSAHNRVRVARHGDADTRCATHIGCADINS